MKKGLFDRFYGWDYFSLFLIAISLPLLFSKYTVVIGLGLLCYTLWRAFSGDMERRRAEEAQFERMMRVALYKITIWAQKPARSIQLWHQRFQQRKFYLYFKCPNCGQMLRVPRNKGTILVTCKVCLHKFKKKS